MNPDSGPPSPPSSRSSWNSLGRPTRGISGGVVGGSLRVRGSTSPHAHYHSHPSEHESLLSHPPPPPLLARGRLPPQGARRAPSLELPAVLRPAGQPPARPDPGGRAGSGAGGPLGLGGGGDHHDCNGKTPAQLIGEVFPQLNTRKGRAELEEDTDYVSGDGGEDGLF